MKSALIIGTGNSLGPHTQMLVAELVSAGYDVQRQAKLPGVTGIEPRRVFVDVVPMHRPPNRNDRGYLKSKKGRA